jgi:hypothetical protein
LSYTVRNFKAHSSGSRNESLISSLLRVASVAATPLIHIFQAAALSR